MTKYVYTFMRNDDPDTIWPTVEIEAESFREASEILQGADDGENVIRDWHSPEGGGDLEDVLRDGEPLRDHWDFGEGEVL